jgi:hypothetical protein
MQSVELPLIDYHRFAGSFKDPQPVVAKHPTSSWLYLSTKHLPIGDDRSNFVIDVDKNGNRIEFTRQTSRLSVVSAGVDNWFIPNVNERNNTIRFFSEPDNEWYTTTLSPGDYINSNSLLEQIVIAMNFAGSSLDFYSAVSPSQVYGPFILTTAGIDNNFYFDPDCDFCKKGSSVCLTERFQEPREFQYLGPMRLRYTDYIDIHSSAITQYQKMRSITTEGRSSLVVRAYLPTEIYGSWRYQSTLLQNLSFAFRSDAVLASIDIQIYDANGDLLYIPTYLQDTINIELIMQAEL